MVYWNSNECLWSGIGRITARYIPETFCSKMKYYFTSPKFSNCGWNLFFHWMINILHMYIYTHIYIGGTGKMVISVTKQCLWIHTVYYLMRGKQKRKRNPLLCNPTQNKQENILKRPWELHLANIVKRQDTTIGNSKVAWESYLQKKNQMPK